MQCIIICGAPASGKSTLARQIVRDWDFAEINRDNIRFSVIDPGGNWTTYRFSKKNEKLVTRIWYESLREAAFSGEDVVISDTLCNVNKRKIVVDECISLGYNGHIVILNPSLETLLTRDANRGKWAVGEDVIISKFKELNNGLCSG